MKFSSIGLRVNALLFAAVVTGCAPFTQYHTQYDGPCVNPDSVFSPNCLTHAIQEFPAADGSRYLLGFIEFDDQGQLWSRKQMWSVIDTLLAEAGKKDLLITIFVHGWKHSAHSDDKNIKTFREVLAGLSENEHQISRDGGRPARRVAGVYLGWRGGSVTIPGVEELTFWDRKNTAQKVSRGEVTEVLSRLELLKRARDCMSRGNSATRLVTVGHSFGGAIVHSSLVQILEDRFVRTNSPKETQSEPDAQLDRETQCKAATQSDVEGFGNLVVLINPAFEALQFAPLSDMATERGTYFKAQLPVVAILTSEADLATKYAFPIGRHLSTLFEKDRDIERKNNFTGKVETIHEGEANVTAIGHFQPYQTHKLYPSGELPEVAAQFSSGKSVESARVARFAWEDDTSGSKIPIAGLTLERTMTSAGRNPYLVIGVDKNLISGHNHIDNRYIIEFIKQLILISTQ